LTAGLVIGTARIQRYLSNLSFNALDSSCSAASIFVEARFPSATRLTSEALTFNFRATLEYGPLKSESISPTVAWDF
jgi:hypothetical protein